MIIFRHVDFLNSAKNMGNPYEPYPKLRHRHKNDCCSVGTSVKFVWATMGRKFLNGNISAKKEDVEL